MTENLNAIKSVLTPASVIRERCQQSREQIAQDACKKVKVFVNSKFEPTLKYIDSMVRASSDLSPNNDYILLMHDAVFKAWNVEPRQLPALITACNEAAGSAGYCAKLTETVTPDNFPVKIVNILLDLLRPVLEAHGYRLQLCMRYGGSREHDCFDIIWGKDD
jgi:hypothetical protein